MKILFSKLREFIPLNVTHTELANTLTMKGIEVEDVSETLWENGREKEKDYLFELSITPNRMDCLSYLGVARELSVIYNINLNYKNIDTDYREPEKTYYQIPISISNINLCGLYIGVIIDNVKVLPSPQWLREFLEKSGIRSINNVVDITNYIMLLWGQPLHAFDLSKLHGPEIIVREARKGEKVKTLDGKDRNLDETMLIIADREYPIAIAGIMGGEASEVTEDTKTILLEAAWFLPQSIRKTSKKLKISTEASYRFERGVDPEFIKKSCIKAIKLISELCGGRQISPITTALGKLPDRKRIIFRPEKARKIIGFPLKKQEMINILTRFDIDVVSQNNEDVVLSPPIRRFDINEEIDFIEEIARIVGFENISPAHPPTTIFPQPSEPLYMFEKDAKKTLKELGIDEVINYSFTNPRNLQNFNISLQDVRNNFIPIQNPLSSEQSIMRTMLLPQLVENLSHNISFNRKDLRLFEVGKIFLKESEIEPFHSEELHAAVLICGRRYPQSWAYPNEGVDFYDIKGIAIYLLNYLCKNSFSFRESRGDQTFMEDGICLDIFSNDEKLGYLGEIKGDVLKRYDINTKVFAMEINLTPLLNQEKKYNKFSPLPKFPQITRDTAFLLDFNINSDEVLGFILEKNLDLLKSAEIFDLYTGKNIDSNKKSLGIRFNYMSDSRTLTDDEVDEIHTRLVNDVLVKFNAKLRE